MPFTQIRKVTMSSHLTNGHHFRKNVKFYDTGAYFVYLYMDTKVHDFHFCHTSGTSLLCLKEGFEFDLSAANYSENKMETQPSENQTQYRPFGKALGTNSRQLEFPHWKSQ